MSEEIIFDGQVHERDEKTSYICLMKRPEQLMDNENLKDSINEMLVTLFNHIHECGLVKECLGDLFSENCLIKPEIVLRPPEVCSPLSHYGTICIKFKTIRKRVLE